MLGGAHIGGEFRPARFCSTPIERDKVRQMLFLEELCMVTGQAGAILVTT
jgi:hypothetical protein